MFVDKKIRKPHNVADAGDALHILGGEECP